MNSEVELQVVSTTKRQSFLDENSNQHYEYDDKTGESSWLASIVIQSHQTAGKCLGVQIPNGGPTLTFTVPPGLVAGDFLLIDASKIILIQTFI